MNHSSCIFCGIITDKKNATLITEMEHSLALLNYDQQHYPGRALVLLKKHEIDMLMLEKSLRDKFFDEVMFIASVIKDLYKADRINYCSLGNEVGATLILTLETFSVSIQGHDFTR